MKQISSVAWKEAGNHVSRLLRQICRSREYATAGSVIAILYRPWKFARNFTTRETTAISFRQHGIHDAFEAANGRENRVRDILTLLQKCRCWYLQRRSLKMRFIIHWRLAFPYHPIIANENWEKFDSFDECKSYIKFIWFFSSDRFHMIYLISLSRL